VFDPIRRPPANMAQLTATLDHYSKGRFFLGLGAGEIKQFAPYGIERTQPFGHLEESVKIVKLLLDSSDVVNYEGPHWNLRNAVLALMPHGEKRPPILIAGGPGRAVDIAAKHADGWITYVPTCGSPEWYAEQVAIARRKTEQAGRDPDAMIFYLLTMNIIDSTEQRVDAHTRDPIARWDAAAVIPGPHVYEAWGVGKHPIRPDYSYPTHLVPTEWSREDALQVIEKTPAEIVRRARACGTPKSVADQLQAYIAAVPASNPVWVNIINYTSFLGGGSFGDPADEVDLVLETCNHLRRMNGQPIPASATASA
jgi:phthiodiolone/phenolphthiodiolone dimycocerosates ketoreductase